MKTENINKDQDIYAHIDLDNDNEEEIDLDEISEEDNNESNLELPSSYFKQHIPSGQIMTKEGKEEFYQVVSHFTTTLEEFRDQELDDSDYVDKINDWILTLSQMRDIIVLDKKEKYYLVFDNLDKCYIMLSKAYT